MTYYLYSGAWYRMISSYYWYIDVAHTIIIQIGGYIGYLNTQLIDNNGGVQFIELCYEYIFAEAG